VVDGYRVDRGFQVINTSYREAARVLDFDALSLRGFTPGAALFRDGRLQTVANPLRRPALLRSTLAAPVGRPLDKVVFGAAAAALAAAPERAVAAALRSTAHRDVAAAEVVRRLGLDGLGTAFLRPFLSGVLLDEDLSATSARFVAPSSGASPAAGSACRLGAWARSPASWPPGCRQVRSTSVCGSVR
jgi:hypothetical protein